MGHYGSDMTPQAPDDAVAGKERLRRRLLRERRAASSADRDATADALSLHLLAERIVAGARRVAAYCSMPEEPGTAPLLAALHARGIEVIVPVVAGDALDWVGHEPGATTSRGPLGVEEPTGPRLGRDALGTVDVVLVPALAVDHRGRRLGRGAGYYDRALAGVTVPLVAVVHARELLPEIPAEPHDVPVHLVVTETGVFRVPQG